MTAESSVESIDIFKENLITKPAATIRVLALNPASVMAEYRFKFLDGRPVSDLNVQNEKSIEDYRKFSDDIKENYSREIRNTESFFGYRLYDAIPYFSYTRCDDIIFLGIYTADRITRQSYVLEIKFKDEQQLFRVLSHNFDTLWADSVKNSIIRIESPNEGR
ncbi:MAG: hypothetical protein P4L35_00565 [Ignavibacteriaceae bacterium]|nr:hypothetical protein [Ignavibacteriaceae bacterium]